MCLAKDVRGNIALAITAHVSHHHNKEPGAYPDLTLNWTKQ